MKHKNIFILLGGFIFLLSLIYFSRPEETSAPKDISLERKYSFDDPSTYKTVDNKDFKEIKSETLGVSLTIPKTWITEISEKEINNETERSLLMTSKESPDCEIYLTSYKEEQDLYDLKETVKALKEGQIERESVSLTLVGEIGAVKQPLVTRIPTETKIFELGMRFSNDKIFCQENYDKILTSLSFTNEK